MAKEEERAFYQRQAARGKMSEQEFDARMDETDSAKRHWEAERVRLTELRDDARKVQSGLDYTTQLLAVMDKTLPEIDQPPDQLRAIDKQRQRAILKKRREIVRALCERVVVWADREVKLFGVLDGSEGAQFGLGSC